ncbi:TonB-dependent receptor [Brucellaceae bacterium C25G]
MTGTAQAQITTTSQAYQFNIPAKSLPAALADVGAVSGWRIAYAFSLPSSVKSAPVIGTMTTEQAIAKLLNGTDISYRISGARSIVLQQLNNTTSNNNEPADSIQLDTITVSNVTNPADIPFTTAGSSAYLSAEQIENVKGTSPGDMLNGITGVTNSDGRNSGSVNVNIRGLQGQGRTPVIVDGSVQETTVYRGYNGAQSRSYIDPDFIGSVSVEKGPSAGIDANGAIGGVVRMSTISANDILLTEKNIGIRLKGGFNTNSSTVPPSGTLGGLRGKGNYHSSAIIPELGSSKGLDRPAFLTPTGGSGSIAIAGRTDNFEAVAAYARRKNGNYHAGKQGNGSAYPIFTPTDYGTTVSYGGLTQFRAGEEVLNTSQDTESWLVKGKYTSDNGHKLELGYTRYSSTYGEIMPTQIWTTTTSGPYQSYLNEIRLDTYTAQYHWKPEETDLIDLKINAYYTDMQLRLNSAIESTSGNNTIITPVLRYSADKRKGINVENTSRFQTSIGDLAVNYGFGFMREDLGLPKGYTYKPSDNMSSGPGRQGNRKEWNALVSAEWKPNDWLTLSSGIRYSHFSVYGHTPYVRSNVIIQGDPIDTSDSGWSPSATLTVEPFENWRIYGKASSALRSPSSYETMAYGVSAALISPEKNKSYEIGTSYLTHDVLTSGDKLRLHGAYFNNNVKNYLTRINKLTELVPGFYYPSLQISNLDYAKMSGVEMTADYDAGRYFAGISWNHYINTMFCAKDGEMLPGRSQCGAGGLYNSFSLQTVPPKDTVTLHLGARFFDEKLTVGSRIMYVGKRMVEGIGDDSEDAYQGNQIQASKWNPYTIVDLYMNYKHTENLEFSAGIDNLTDRYYMDALNASLMPAPGRTFRFNMTAKF